MTYISILEMISGWVFLLINVSFELEMRRFLVFVFFFFLEDHRKNISQKVLLPSIGSKLSPKSNSTHFAVSSVFTSHKKQWEEG